ncbi:MAG: hypothetical protein WC747_04325 [Candidatus Babeliales bacterium]|jgi:hypothetical protein
MRQAASGIRYFTINQSRIGGPDILKSGGDFVTFFDKFRYDDATPFVTSISVQKNIGQYPYGIIMAQADVELDNTSKKFLPGFDTTVGSGTGLPNRPIKISIGIEDEYLKLFTGYTSQPKATLNKRVVQMHAFDAFNYINGYRSTISGAFQNAPLHNVIASGMYEMGFSASQFIIDKSLQQNIGYLATYDRKWGDIFKDGTEAEQALMFVDENGIIRFWNRQHFTTFSGVAKFQLNYSKLSDLQWQNTPIINDVIVKAKPRAVQAQQKIWEATSNIELPAGLDTEYFVDFADDFGPLPTTSVSIPRFITTASGSQSYYASNDQSDGSGDARSSYVSVLSAYSFGTTYKLVFRNTFTSTIYLNQLVIYATPAKVTQVIEERYQDPTSIDAFGRNPSNNGEPITIENDLIQDKSTARSLAYTLVKEYKSPGKRYICPVARQSDPALQIGDPGLLQINDTNETKTVYITGITNVIGRNGKYDQALEVEERAIKRYFTINVSRIGGTDSIAP